MSSIKAQQRSTLQEKRTNLSAANVDKLSKNICAALFGHIDWPKHTKVHVYLPITSKKEVSTWPLIRRLWQEHPKVQIYTSVYGESRSLHHVIINSKTKFEDDSLGIPMPISDYEQRDTKYDLIIIPVLGFDNKLNRLGYGRGVYDTFLQNQPAALKVGLAYEFSKLESIENEPHDVKLDEVLTEVKLYN